MENWARISYREMVNSDDDVCNNSEYDLDMNDISNDISRTVRLDEHDLIPNRPSKISINLGHGNPFETSPSVFYQWNCKKLTIIIIVCVLCLSFGILLMVNRNSGSGAEPIICLSRECGLTAAHFLQNMDMNVKPCDDFYQFMCGNWHKNNHRLDFDWYTEQQAKIQSSIELFLELNENSSNPKTIKKMCTMFKACMNTTQIDILGLQPMIDYLKKFYLPTLPKAILVNISPNINVSTNAFDWIKSIAEIQKGTGLDVIIGFDVISNRRNQTKRNRNHIYLGIPIDINMNDVNEDNMAKKIFDVVSFVNPIVNTTNIQPLVKKWVKKIISVRKILNELIKDAQNMSIDPAQNATDQTTEKILGQYLEIIFADTQPKYNLKELLIRRNRADTYYLQKLMKYISKNKESQIDLELYIWWEVVERMMSDSMVTNKQINLPRSSYCTQMVENYMGIAVSFLIFPPEIMPKVKKMRKMINDTLFAYTMLTQQFTWMDIETQRFMLEKISSVESFVGFPEWIQNDDKLDEFYAELNFNESTHLINLMNVLKWQMHKKLKSFNSRQSVEWPIQSYEVNVSYTLEHNTITVPWIVLQYPFYYLGLDALDYGAIGSIIGHELMHIFDLNGRMYGQDGEEYLWWTNKTLIEFINRSECFSQQYSEFFKSELGIDIDGRTGLIENIADHGGLRGAFHAYKILYTPGKEEIPNLPVFTNYTHEQLFFMSYANSHCELQKKDSFDSALKTNEYAPGRFRVNGVLANLDEFSNAFKCSPNSKMISKKKCTI